MKTNITKISYLFIAFLTASCMDSDWLTPKPLSFYAPENVYTDESGFEAMLVSMRKNLRSEHDRERSPMVNEHAMSDLGAPLALPNSVVKNFVTNLTPAGDGGSHDFPGRLFNLAYNSIRNANVLISRVDNINWSDEQTRNRLLAGGYFFRAYWYYRLINSYGDIPFIGEEITGPRLDFHTHSRWAILDRIQQDLEWAVNWLPEKAAPGMETKGAAYHLLAKIALANTDFDTAISAATNVINGPYQLMTERFGIDANDNYRNVIWDLHRSDNVNYPGNTETILAVVDRFDDPDGVRSSGGLFLPRDYNPAWWQNGRDSQGGVGMIASGIMYDTLFRGNGNCRLTQYYLYEIWDFQNDIRRSDANWVEGYELKYNNPVSVDYGKSVNRANYAVPSDTLKHNYSFPHYKTYVPHQIPTANPTGGHGDMYIFRLAETYLLRAEAYYWKKDLPNAARDINIVRQRAGALPLSPQEITIDELFDERARELCLEEPRHGELVRAAYIMARKNLLGYSLTSFSERNWFYDRVMATNWFFQVNLPWGDQIFDIAPHNALWPIPQTVIAANTLGVINQNQGYFGAERNVEPISSIE